MIIIILHFIPDTECTEEINVCVELISKLFTGVKHLVTFINRGNKKSIMMMGGYSSNS